MSMAMSIRDKKWEAEEDMRTLRRAAEVQRDKKRLAAAQRIAQAEVVALQRIGGRTVKGTKKNA